MGLLITQLIGNAILEPLSLPWWLIFNDMSYGFFKNDRGIVYNIRLKRYSR